jgi:hypothetical protein
VAMFKIFVICKDNYIRKKTIFYTWQSAIYRYRFEYVAGRRRHNDFVTLKCAKTNHGDDFVTRQHAKTKYSDKLILLRGSTLKPIMAMSLLR